MEEKMAKVPSLGLSKKERIDFFFQECVRSWDVDYMRKSIIEPDYSVRLRSAMVFLLFCDLVRKKYEKIGADFCIPVKPF